MQLPSFSKPGSSLRQRIELDSPKSRSCKLAHIPGCQLWRHFDRARFCTVMAYVGFDKSSSRNTRSWLSSWYASQCDNGRFTAEILVPGCTYLITCWYTRYEVGKRLAVFWILATVAGAFSGILAYGLSKLAGRDGLAGWRCKSISDC